MRRVAPWSVIAFLSVAFSLAFGKPSTPEEFERLWHELGSADGARAYRAMGEFAEAPERAVTFLAGRVRPVVALPRERVIQLIANLASDKFTVRDKAYGDLEDSRELAETELEKALAGDPELEARRRLERLLEKRDLLKSPERLQSLRAIEILENIGTRDAVKILQKLADGAAEARQTQEAKASLARLARRARQ